MKGNKGSISLLAMFFIFIISSLIFLGFKKIITTEKMIKTRAKHYLCVKEVITINKNHIRVVENINKLIIANNALLYNPKTRVYGLGVLRVLKGKQNLSLANALRKSTTSKNCPAFFKALIIKKLPYGQVFKRDPLNMAKLRKKKWNITHRNYSLKNHYYTKMQFQAKGNGFTSIHTKVEEYPKKGLAAWSFLSGVEF